MNEKPPLIRRTWFLVVMCIFLPPVGLVCIWMAKRPQNMILRIILTILLVSMSISMLSNFKNGNDSTDQVAQHSEDVAVSDETVEEEPVATEAKEEETTTEDKEAAKKEEEEKKKKEEAEKKKKEEEEKKKQEAEKKKKEYKSYDVKELEDDLESNALSAKEKYNDKNVKLKGKLNNIDSDGAYISITDPDNEWDFTGVQCYVTDKKQLDVIKKLSVGDIIIVKGKIKSVGEVLGYSMDIEEIKSAD